MAGRVSGANKVFLLLVLGLGALLVGVIVADRRSGLDYTITFHDPKDLKPGAAVKLHGIPIGKVTSIRLGSRSENLVEAGIHIEQPYRERIHASPNSTARIRTDSLVFGKPYVEILNRGDRGGGMQNGTVVAGMEGWTDEKLWTSTGKLSSGFERALTIGRSHFDKLEDWAASEKGLKLRGQVDEFLASLESAASTGASKAQDQLGMALEKGTELLKNMKTEDAKEMAADVQKSLEALLAENKDMDDEMKKKLSAAMADLERFKAEKLDPAAARLGAKIQGTATPAPAGTEEKP